MQGLCPVPDDASSHRPITYNTMDERSIERAWAEEDAQGNMTVNWLTLEKDVRHTLREYRAGHLTAEAALYFIDQFVAARTGRGTEHIPFIP